VHYYQYLHDPDFVIESEEPRPDLLEWAYWAEIPAPARKPEPEPTPEFVSEPDREPEAEPQPVVKAVRKPRAKATESE
jgi:hypothetical protein